MAKSASRQIAVAFIILLTTQEFRPLHSVQKLSLKEQNKMSNFSGISHKTPDEPTGMPHLHLDNIDHFENKTNRRIGSDTSPDEDWTTAEVNITLPVSSSGFASKKVNTASIPEISSSQGLNDEPGATEKLKMRNDSARNLQNHSSSRLNFTTGIQRSDSYPGKELRSETDRIYMNLNLSIRNDLKFLNEHGVLNNISSDDAEVDKEIGAQGDQFEPLDLQFVETIDMTPPVIDRENEEALIYTCADKCGEETLLPCSCSALCVVYDTCCENFSQDCPHILQDARYEFGDLITSDKFCDVDSIFIISSCPRHGETQYMEDNELQPNKTDKLLKEPSENVSSIRVTKFESLTTSLARAGAEETAEKKLKTAALRAPVTDASSGITYINKTVYDCHKHEDNNFFMWALKLNYVLTNPRSLEDLGDLEDLDQYEPLFNRAILSRHECLAGIISACPATRRVHRGEESDDKKCAEFFGSVIRMKAFYTEQWYRNRFCAYCNEGRNKTYALRYRSGNSVRENDLRMLMSFNNAGRINIRAKYPPFISPKFISLTKVSCTPASAVSGDMLQGNLSSITSGQRSVCSVKCSGSGFTLRGDGHCKAPHAAKVAVSDDGLPPLCSEALQALASFILCGVQSMMHTMPHAEFRRTTTSVLIDSKTRKTLYVVKIEVDAVYTFLEFFSSTDEESMINWRHLEVLAKSLKRYRLSSDLYGSTDCDTKNFRSDMQQIESLSFADFVSSSWNLRDLFQQREGSLGPALDANTTTTFCMSPLGSPKTYEDAVLVCSETFDYASDAKAIAGFLDSPCFSHLDDVQLAKSGGSVTILKDKGSNLQTHWFLAVVLGIFMVKKPHV